MKKLKYFMAVIIGSLVIFSTTAKADFIKTIAGNDCSGVFGQGFANCKIPTEYDENNSPVIIKFDVLDSGSFDTPEINSDLFPSIDGSEFSFTGSGSTGTWTYNPGTDDPDINFFVAKGGPNFNLFSNLGAANSDDWYTPGNPSKNNPDKLYGLSHLTFYDTGSGTPNEVPEPISLLLIGSGIMGLAFIRRRKS